MAQGATASENFVPHSSLRWTCSLGRESRGRLPLFSRASGLLYGRSDGEVGCRWVDEEERKIAETCRMWGGERLIETHHINDTVNYVIQKKTGVGSPFLCPSPCCKNFPPHFLPIIPPLYFLLSQKQKLRRDALL